MLPRTIFRGPLCQSGLFQMTPSDSLRHFHVSAPLEKVRKRPLMENFEKRLLRAMTAPIYPNEVLYPVVKVKPLTPYQQHCQEYSEYMTWKINGVLDGQSCLGFYFNTNPRRKRMEYREWNLTVKTFREAGLHLREWKAEYIRSAVDGTRFHNLQNILNENVILCHVYVDFTEGMPKGYVPKPSIDTITAVKEMIRLGRTTPKLTFLGGVIDNQLMTRAQFMECQDLVSVGHQQAQLSATLGSIPSETSSLLVHHQNLLGSTLASYINEASKETVEGNS